MDAIKHQAKTVTVGISRSDESLLDVPLVEAALRTGAGRDSLPYSALRTLAELDPSIAEVTGYTRYLAGGRASSWRRASLTVVVPGRGGGPACGPVPRTIPGCGAPRPWWPASAS